MGADMGRHGDRAHIDRAAGADGGAPHLASARNEAQALVIQASAAAQSAQARADAAEQSLSEVKAELASSASRMQQLEQDLAREQGVRATLECQEEEMAEQRRGPQRSS
jgi:regulator of protease activity HflC (stomatin/prohibitin superfamily)